MKKKGTQRKKMVGYVNCIDLRGVFVEGILRRILKHLKRIPILCWIGKSVNERHKIGVFLHFQLIKAVLDSLDLPCPPH